MIKILIVEDNNSKLRSIVSCLVEIDGICIDCITHVVAVSDALINLKTHKFDLMIFDMVIPLRIDLDADRSGGIKLFKDIMNRNIYIAPNHFIAITQYNDIFEDLYDYCSQELLSIIKYSDTEDLISTPLRAQVSRIILSKSASPYIQEYKCDLAIICALRSPELEHVLNLGWNWVEYLHPFDETLFYRAEVEINGQIRVIYAANSARMGMVSSSILSTKMIEYFRPRYLCMTGITAGIHGKVNLGDIISPDVVWDWGSGKWSFGNDVDSFLPEPYQQHINIDMKLKLHNFSLSPHIQNIKRSWLGNKPDFELKLHVGPTATGASVIANQHIRDTILSQHRKLIGIEMELYGVFESSYQSSSPRPSIVAFKSVVDFADSIKNDEFQQYSSYASAMAMKLFFENYIWSCNYR